MTRQTSLGQVSIGQFIREYLDPYGDLTPDDNPAEIVRQLDSIYREDGGCGVTVEEMREYLAGLDAAPVTPEHREGAER